jgi:AP-2 complex subunit alpha
MPPFPEKQSPLLVRLKQKKTLTEAEGNTETPTTTTTHTEDTTPKLTVPLAQQQEQQNGLLVSLDTNESNGYSDQSTSYSLPSITTTTTTTKKFLFKNSDIIFENDLLQIGIKAELKKNILHIEFYYGNKTNFNLSNISTNINLYGELESG